MKRRQNLDNLFQTMTISIDNSIILEQMDKLLLLGSILELM